MRREKKKGKMDNNNYLGMISSSLPIGRVLTDVGHFQLSSMETKQTQLTKNYIFVGVQIGKLTAIQNMPDHLGYLHEQLVIQKTC